MIFLLRHGETKFNAMGRRQGQIDSPLTPKGQAQALAMGQRLAGLLDSDFRLFVSPLGRARQTADLILTQTGPAPITLDPRLMEVTMGAWDGLTEDEIARDFPGQCDGMSLGQAYFHGPGGESYPVFAARLADAMAEVMADPASHRVIVAHGVVSRVIRAQWQGLTPEQSYDLPVPQDGFYGLGPDRQVTFWTCPAPAR